MSSHKKHLFAHAKFISGVNFKEDTSPLPTDKRRIPHPAIRKLGLKVKTMGEFHHEHLRYIINEAQNHLLDHLNLSIFPKKVFNV